MGEFSSKFLPIFFTPTSRAAGVLTRYARCPSPKCGHGEPTSTPTPAGSPLFRGHRRACQRVTASAHFFFNSLLRVPQPVLVGGRAAERALELLRALSPLSSSLAACQPAPGRTLYERIPRALSRNCCCCTDRPPPAVNPSVSLQKKAYKVRRVLDLSTRSPDSLAVTAVPVARCSRLCWRPLFRLACRKCVVLSTRPSRGVHPRACANGRLPGEPATAIYARAARAGAQGSFPWRCA